jgi:hypothetical protein
MRRLSITLLTALAFPLAALAQSVKQVEVTNLPAVQDVTGAVEVTNLPDVQDVNIVGGAGSSCEVKTLQLVGFTSTLYTGNLGGVWGSTQKCQLEFPGSRMCTTEEAQTTVNLPTNIPQFSWIDPFEGIQGRGSCAGDLFIGGVDIATRPWTCDLLEAPCRFDPSWGATLESNGARLPMLCNVEQPIACCGPVP